MPRPKKPTVIGKVTVGRVGEDARFPRPFFFTVMTAGEVQHERFHSREQAETARRSRITQLRSARKRRKGS